MIGDSIHDVEAAHRGGPARGAGELGLYRQACQRARRRSRRSTASTPCPRRWSRSPPVDGSCRSAALYAPFRALSSAGEHTLHTGGVVGSIPTAPTISLARRRTSMTNALSLRPGDRVPDFALPGLDGKLRKFIWSFTGDPVALLAVDDLGNLDAAQFDRLIDRLQGVRRSMPVVVAGNAVGRGSRAWAKLGGDRRGRLLLCDAERKFLPALLAQGGVGFGPGGGPAHARDRARSQPARRRDLRQPRPARRRRGDGRARPLPCAPTAAPTRCRADADGARPGAAARVRAASSAPS